jgi:hypothetical protein
MRNFLKWTVILSFVVGIFGCAQKSTSGFEPNSEPDGFAGIKWGTPFSEVKSDMVESRSISDPAEPNVKIKIHYTQKGDPLKMGEAQLDKVEYVFWQGKFAEARINATGPENFDRLKTFLFEKFGTVNKSQGAFFWDGSVTQIYLKYDGSAKPLLLTISSTTMTSREVKDLFDKDKF